MTFEDREAKLLGRMPMRRLIFPLTLLLALVFAGSAHAFVYWADFSGGTIGRANLDGTAVEDHFIQTGGHPLAVAVNSTYIYWANESTGTIGRAKLDGTAVEPAFISGIAKPFGVAVSPTAIFWASLGGNEIGRANLDGTGKNLGLVTGVNSPCSIAIDSGHVYWGSASLTSFVGRASLTGSSPEREWVNLGTYTPCALATNSANVFFGNTGFLGAHAHEIGRVDINGTGLDKSIIGEAEGPCGMAVYGSRLFWANQGTGTIGVANTDATAVDESLVQTGAGEICGVAVDSLSPPPAPPGPGPTPTPEPSPSGGSTTGPSAGGGQQSAPTPPPLAGAIQLGPLKRDPAHGTARLSVVANEAGAITLSGKNLIAVKAGAAGAGSVNLTVRATKAGKKVLRRTGRLATTLTVVFKPADGGSTATSRRSVTLRKR